MNGDDGTPVAAVLAGAQCARSEAAAAERALHTALSLEPDGLEVQLAAYRFYFYNHRLAEALPHAAHIITLMAQRLDIAADWRLVRPDDAAFTSTEEAPSLYLQALLAWGYASVRLGRTEEGRHALATVAELDPCDRFGARRLHDVVAAGADAGENADES